MYLIGRALGYYEVAEMSGNCGKPAAMREDESRKNHIDTNDVTFYKPDFSQMVPFKPKVQWASGEHVAPGITPYTSIRKEFQQNVLKILRLDSERFMHN